MNTNDTLQLAEWFYSGTAYGAELGGFVITTVFAVVVIVVCTRIFK